MAVTLPTGPLLSLSMKFDVSPDDLGGRYGAAAGERVAAAEALAAAFVASPPASPAELFFFGLGPRLGYTPARAGRQQQSKALSYSQI